MRGWFGEEELVAEGFQEGEVVGVVGDADLMGRVIAGVGGDQVEPVAFKWNGTVAQGIGEAGDTVVLGVEGAGDRKADFEGQGGIGFGEGLADLLPGMEFQPFGKGLTLDEELGPGGVEDLLIEGRSGGGVDILAIGQADDGTVYSHSRSF